MKFRILLMLILAPCLEIAASGQTVVNTGSPATPRAGGERIGFRGYGIVELEKFTAANSFAAVVTGSEDSARLLGIGADVTNLWKGLFAHVAVTHVSLAGSRAFVDSSGIAHSLGIPMTIDVTPIELGAGWRFASRQPRRLVPYLGAALLIQRYKESSSFAETSETVDTSDRGNVLFGGLEFDAGMLRVLVEAQHRAVPNVLGLGGVSAAFHETDLGGNVFRVGVGIGF